MSLLPPYAAADVLQVLDVPTPDVSGVRDLTVQADTKSYCAGAVGSPRALAMLLRWEEPEIVRPLRRLRWNSIVGWIGMVEVERDARRRGLGSRLLRRWLREAAMRGVRTTYLSVMPMDNVPHDVLVRFYEAHGFRRFDPDASTMRRAA